MIAPRGPEMNRPCSGLELALLVDHRGAGNRDPAHDDADDPRGHLALAPRPVLEVHRVRAVLVVLFFIGVVLWGC